MIKLDARGLNHCNMSNRFSALLMDDGSSNQISKQQQLFNIQLKTADTLKTQTIFETLRLNK